MEIQFAVSAWAACAPGLYLPAHWTDWAGRPCLPSGPVEIALPELPAMQRRRLGLLGRLAVRVACDAAPVSTGIPLVFASRYGDAERALGVLRSHTLGEGVSPTDFALSVHNAIAGLYSIARQEVGPCTSVAAGPTSAAAALAEAAGLLADGAPEVLVVHYDAPLPAPYAAFADEAQAPFAWAWRVGSPQPGQPFFSLTSSPPSAPLQAAPSGMPFGLDAMRFLAGDLPQGQVAAGGRHWTWRRHA